MWNFFWSTKANRRRRASWHPLWFSQISAGIQTQSPDYRKRHC